MASVNLGTTISPGTTVRLQAEYPRHWSLADLQARLGDIPAERIRLFPPPGYGTEEDVTEIQAHENRLYELEDGVLVEKAMGWYESAVAILIATAINKFLEVHDRGKVLGADGTLKILPGMVKIPDVSFISWERWPKQRLPRRPIPSLVPDLAVEVLSEANTEAEMAMKLENYFKAGVAMVWHVDPETRSAISCTRATTFQEIDEQGSLDGGEVLPGFRLKLIDLFREADRQGPRET